MHIFGMSKGRYLVSGVKQHKKFKFDRLILSSTSSLTRHSSIFRYLLKLFNTSWLTSELVKLFKCIMYSKLVLILYYFYLNLIVM